VASAIRVVASAKPARLADSDSYAVAVEALEDRLSDLARGAEEVARASERDRALALTLGDDEFARALELAAVEHETAR
jgi:hypothetical protein